MAKDKPSREEPSRRPRIAVPSEQGEFVHQAEEAESPCATSRPDSRCQCGMYNLAWGEIPAATPESV